MSLEKPDIDGAIALGTGIPLLLIVVVSALESIDNASNIPIDMPTIKATKFLNDCIISFR
jgi:hypothetical protein